MDYTASRNYFGIDPAIVNTGLALIQENGIDKPTVYLETYTTTETGSRRLKQIGSHLRSFITSNGYSNASNEVCLEGASLRSTNRANDIGEMRGAVLLTLYNLDLEPLVVAPKRLKKFATGNGAAGKSQMIKAAIEFWNVVPNTDDEADALWLATIGWALDENPRMKRFQLELLKTIRDERI